MYALKMLTLTSFLNVPNLKANFLASPPLVVAYAITGTMLRDLMTEPLGKGKDGKQRFMRGLEQAPDGEYLTDRLTTEAEKIIAANQDKPFFLYLSTHDIHVPRAPDPQFRGKSEIGLRGDALTQFDWTVGQVLAKLDELKLTDNTLVILSSDNGGVFDNNGPDWEHGVGSPEARDNKMTWMGHNCNGALRGGKSSIYEGGTRVPFITRWPGRIQPGVSDALISQVDLLGSMAALTGQSLAKADAPDSLNCLPALLGEKQGTDCRDHLIERGSHLGPLGLRKGSWKYIASQTKVPKSGKAKDGANATKVVAGELYDLAADLGETNNVAAQHPEIVAAMSAQLEALKSAGRTRP